MKIKIILVLLLTVSVKAQDYKLFVASSAQSIQLKWMSKSLDDNSSFDIYRKEGSGTWQKLNEKAIITSPIIKESELKSSKNLFPNDSSYAYYITHKSKKETNPNKKAYANYLLAMAGIYDNNLAQHLGVYFEDTNISSGKKYQYKLVQSALQKELSISVIISLGDTAEAPKEVKAIQEKQNVKLTWKVNEDFIGYNIYKNNQKLNEEPVLASSEGTIYKVSFTDENVKPENCKYIIKGITFLNTESKPSNEIVIDVKDATPPTGIRALRVARNNNEIKLNWLTSKDKDVKGYFVYKSEDNGKTFTKQNTSILDVKTQEFSEKLTSKTFGTFLYYIEAVDAFGNKSKSMTVSAFLPDNHAPEIPKLVTSKSESGKITLSWTANSEKDLAGYRIYRGLKNDDENSMLLLNSEPIKTTSFSDVFPDKASTKFIYKVAAIDQSFNESKKAEIWVQLPDVIPPKSPFLESATLQDNRVVLKWNLIPNDAIMSYDVYRVFENKKEKLNLNSIIQDTFTDDKLGKNGLYCYYIQAVDSAKLVSEPSNSLYVSSVVSNSKNQIKLVAKQDIRSKKVQLEIIGIKPSEVQLLKLYRKTGNSGFKLLPFSFINSTFIDETSEIGKIYHYYIDVTDLDEIRVKSEVVTINNS